MICNTLYFSAVSENMHLEVRGFNFTYIDTWPSETSCESSDKSEEHGRVHVVLVVDFPSEQDNVSRVERRPEQGPPHPARRVLGLARVGFCAPDSGTKLQCHTIFFIFLLDYAYLSAKFPKNCVFCENFPRVFVNFCIWAEKILLPPLRKMLDATNTGETVETPKNGQLG